MSQLAKEREHTINRLNLHIGDSDLREKCRASGVKMALPYFDEVTSKSLKEILPCRMSS